MFYERRIKDEIIEVNFKKKKKITLLKAKKKIVKLHSISSKHKIIKFPEEYGRKGARDKYSIPESTLRDWSKKKKRKI